MKSENHLINPQISHIYTETNASDYRIAKQIINKFPHAKIVTMNNYKDFFNRPNQNLILQKKSIKLILAVKKHNFLYKVPDICQKYDTRDFYYTSGMLNCNYNCGYCFLQGMYPSSNIVVFVNFADFASAIENKLFINPITLSVSYDCDLLAFEPIFPYTSLWLDFAAKHPEINIEIRTKSNNFDYISNIVPTDNVVLAWTLSPEKVIKTYEKRTPCLNARISSIKRAISRGWKVRLCFDPLLVFENWQYEYSNFIHNVFSEIPSKQIYDVSTGVFRMPADYLKKIRKRNIYNDIIFYPFDIMDGIATYSVKTGNDLLHHVYNLISDYVPENIIHI